MNTINRENIRLLQSDMMEALKDVALKHGVQFSYKGGNFTPENVTLKIEAALLGANGVAETKERNNFVRYAGMYNLKPEWIDQTFELDEDTYTIVGLNTRKQKCPVLCKNSAGKTYCIRHTTVQMAMNAKEMKASLAA